MSQTAECVWNENTDEPYKRILEICALLGYYTAYNGTSSPTFREEILSVTSSRVMNTLLTIDDGTGRLSRNVGKELPLYSV
jgi:hypothetical protein